MVSPLIDSMQLGEGHGRRISAIELHWPHPPSSRKDLAERLMGTLTSDLGISKRKLNLSSLIDDRGEPIHFTAGSKRSNVVLAYYNGVGNLNRRKLVWVETWSARRTDDGRSGNSRSSKRPIREVKWVDVESYLGKLGDRVILITDYDEDSQNVDGLVPTLSDESQIKVLQSLRASSKDSLTVHLVKSITRHLRQGIDITLHALVGGGTQYLELQRPTGNHSITPVLIGVQVSRIPVPPVSHTTTIKDRLKLWLATAPPSVYGVRATFEGPTTASGPQLLKVLVLNDGSHTDESDITYCEWIHKLHMLTETERVLGGLLARTSQSPEEERDVEIVLTQWNGCDPWTTFSHVKKGDYRKVMVFPFVFEEMGFNTKTSGTAERKEADLIQEIKDLSATLRARFDFDVRSMFQIPPGVRGRGLKKQLKDELLRSWGSSNGRPSQNLLILIYSGHGENQDGRMQLSGGKDSNVDWAEMQDYLDELPCDVAQILDCCFGGATAKAAVHGRNEILAAANSQEKTYTGRRSYLKVVNEVIGSLANEKRPFSLETLHNFVDTATRNHNTNGATRHPDRFRKLHNESGHLGSIYLWPKDADTSAARLPDLPVRLADKKIYARIDLDGEQQPSKISYMTASQVIKDIRDLAPGGQ